MERSVTKAILINLREFPGQDVDLFLTGNVLFRHDKEQTIMAWLKLSAVRMIGMMIIWLMMIRMMVLRRMIRLMPCVVIIMVRDNTARKQRSQHHWHSHISDFFNP